MSSSPGSSASTQSSGSDTDEEGVTFEVAVVCGRTKVSLKPPSLVLVKESDSFESLLKRLQPGGFEKAKCECSADHFRSNCAVALNLSVKQVSARHEFTSLRFTVWPRRQITVTDSFDSETLSLTSSSKPRTTISKKSGLRRHRKKHALSQKQLSARQSSAAIMNSSVSSFTVPRTRVRSSDKKGKVKRGGKNWFYDKKEVAKRYKVFRDRPSLLDRLLMDDLMSSIYYIVLAALLVLVVSTLLDDWQHSRSVRGGGVFASVEVLTWNFSKLTIALQCWLQMFLYQYVGLMPLHLLWSSLAPPDKPTYMLLLFVALYFAPLLYLPPVWCARYDLNFACAMIVCCEQVRFMLKSSAFIVEHWRTHWWWFAREQARRKQRMDEHLFKAMSAPVVAKRQTQMQSSSGGFEEEKDGGSGKKDDLAKKTRSLSEAIAVGLGSEDFAISSGSGMGNGISGVPLSRLSAVEQEQDKGVDADAEVDLDTEDIEKVEEEEEEKGIDEAESGGQSAEETKSHSPISEEPIPHWLVEMNMTAGRLFEKLTLFLFVPTLVYRSNYPRTPHMNLRRALRYLLDVALSLLCVWVIFCRFCIPVYCQSIEKPGDIHALVSEFINSSFPGLMLLAVAFYSILHCWMNFWGEILRFADREFYKDWWNSRSFGQYYRKWNCVVHDWIYNYMYLPALENGMDKNMAMLMVFMTSAIIHEYVLTVGMKFFYPLLLVMFGGVGVFFIPLTSMAKNSENWNVFLWSNLLIGQGILLVLYGREWFAQYDEDALKYIDADSYMPRSWQLIHYFYRRDNITLNATLSFD